MRTKYNIRNQEALHFISFATVELIDACLLVRRDLAIHLWAKVADMPEGTKSNNYLVQKLDDLLYEAQIEELI
jgi:hypothetical protein